jgi:hypothetical protein
MEGINEGVEGSLVATSISPAELHSNAQSVPRLLRQTGVKGDGGGKEDRQKDDGNRMQQNFAFLLPQLTSPPSYARTPHPWEALVRCPEGAVLSMM